MTVDRRKFLAGCALLPFVGCSGSEKNSDDSLLSLKALYRDKFRIGSIVTADQLNSNNQNALEILGREFNALTMENAMKWEHIHPTLEHYNWQSVDAFLALCEQQQSAAVGHVLVWHSQTPDWVFFDNANKPLSRTELLERMLGHIRTITKHCRGRIWAWDVVNEAIEDDGSLRQSPWLKQIGPDFIAKAFTAAHEADPSARLIYNDYNMHIPAKREAVVALVRQLRSAGAPIHGIGMQGHIGLEYPSLAEFEKSIIAFAAEGIEVHISELDIDVLPNPYLGADVSTRLQYSEEKDPYQSGLPDAVAIRQADRAEELFKLFLKHQEKIARVSFWGLSDRDSWKNDFPIPGRTNYPLLYNRDFQEKTVLHRLKSIKQR